MAVVACLVCLGIVTRAHTGVAQVRHEVRIVHRGHRAVSAHERLMTGPLGVPRARDGSGTAWLPDDSPMDGVMASAGAGGVMLHAHVFAGGIATSGTRGERRFASMNWLMASAWYPLGPGEISVRAMLSAEPLTVGHHGYPLLLQTGETIDGAPLHDRQHPYDLWMELALRYRGAFGDSVGFELYAAPVGEPALGPVAFPHRPSAMPNPFAPLGHHWQDATHVSFGVLTAGLFTKHLKIEGSWFNGREPDETRWDWDLRAPDSLSGRVTWNPDAKWSMQASYAHLESPEGATPNVSVQRATVSIAHHVRFGDHAQWASLALFGENFASDGTKSPAFLLESALTLGTRHTVFGRLEYVRKRTEDLAIGSPTTTSLVNVGSGSAGYTFSFPALGPLVTAIGLCVKADVTESSLRSVYGSNVLWGAMVFLELRTTELHVATE